jgi:hypothetical protein
MRADLLLDPASIITEDGTTAPMNCHGSQIATYVPVKSYGCRGDKSLIVRGKIEINCGGGKDVTAAESVMFGITVIFGGYGSGIWNYIQVKY